MTLLLKSAPPIHLTRGSSSRLLDPQDGPMLSSLLVRKARSAHDLTLDLTAHAQRKLRTVVSELFQDVLSSEKPPSARPPPNGVALFPIDRLPEELLIAILLYLDGSSIAACNQTCRGLRQAISHSMQLQYKITLFSCGMRDGPREDVDHEVQLKRLLTYDAAWGQLAWTETRLIPLTGLFHPVAMSGSTMAFMLFGPGPVSGFRLLIQQFPSALRGTEARQWELQFQLTIMHDTLMDVSQDLLVFLEPDALATNYTTMYRMFSLSTGGPHPLAANDGIIEVPAGRAISLAGSGLYGDYIGAVAYGLSDKSTHLVLWNWKTGECKVDARLPTPVMGLRPTFSFLNQHHIVAGFLWSNASQPRDLLVCALDHQRLLDDGPIDTVRTYLFRIPKTLKRSHHWEIHTHRSIVPLYSDGPPDPGNVRHYHHYFDNDPTDQLFMIEMASRRHASSPEGPDPLMSLCIPARTILRRIARAGQSPPPATPLVFPWEQWGPRGALLTKRLDSERRLPYISRVCGLRHVVRKPIACPDGGPAVIRVLDFHAGRATRIAKSRAGNGSSPPPSSSLYAAIEVPLPVELHGVDPVMISTSLCQDGLLVCERMDHDNGGVKRLFVCSF
ncbi:hypothetical protein EDB92DRAFT_1574589 [Lactarius akahatsu]|uniref:F-box domain-containing protein n=1 Tax=Lactarius akahatsu TaxID=416441 RepID=A0AAD4Q7H3_9AGAM|nr:hypothetical protein EDB92DRAFT_797387 [Lactarius akahatsu]KAH8983466.1 hypothetical protein EDB92DRAFT_1574589 [Lactarius akahatsu]